VLAAWLLSASETRCFTHIEESTMASLQLEYVQGHVFDMVEGRRDSLTSRSMVVTMLVPVQNQGAMGIRL
jgi:hypothetical protein